MAAHPAKTIADLQPGDHLCLVYDTEQEHQQILTTYVRHGLQRGERVVYFADDHTPALLLDYLKGDPGLGRALDSGQLQLLLAQDVYFRDGTFDLERTIAFLLKCAEQALHEGYPALRATGEMGWSLRGIPGADTLFEYESRLNDVFPGRPLIGLCQYNRRHFPPESVLHALLTHPLACVRSQVIENRSYMRPADYLEHGNRKAVLERLNRQVSWHPTASDGALTASDIDRLLAALGLPPFQP